MSNDSDSSAETAHRLKKKVHKKHRDCDFDNKSIKKRHEKRSRSLRRKKYHKHNRRDDMKRGRGDNSESSSSSSDYRIRDKKKKRCRAHKRRRKESRKESDGSSIEGYEEKSRREKRTRKSRRTDDGNKKNGADIQIRCDESTSKRDRTKKMSKIELLQEKNRKVHPDEKERRETNTPQKLTRHMKPMSKEEYEKLQSSIREVYDPLSGRYRLVRGTGEIIERIVSKSDHQRINQIATRGDGMSFSKRITDAATRRSK